MRFFRRIDLKLRIVISLTLLGLSLLLLGATRMNESRNSRVRAQNDAREQCRNAVIGLSEAIPPESRASWNALVKEHPELCLRATHAQFRKLPE